MENKNSPLPYFNVHMNSLYVLEKKDVHDQDVVFNDRRCCDGDDAFSPSLGSSLSVDLYRNLLSKCFRDDFDSGSSRNDVFYDVIFDVCDKKIPAHRAIVSARSSFFRALFLNEMMESGSNVVLIEDCTSEIFQCLMLWMYTDQFKLPENCSDEVIENSKVWMLWRAATYFCMDALIEQIEIYITKHLINERNVCSFWNVVNQINAHNLQEYCKKYFQENIGGILETKNFLLLSRDLIAQVFLNANSQIPFQFKTIALTRWFAANNPTQLKRKLETMESFNPRKRRKLTACLF